MDWLQIFQQLEQTKPSEPSEPSAPSAPSEPTARFEEKPHDAPAASAAAPPPFGLVEAPEPPQPPQEEDEEWIDEAIQRYVDRKARRIAEEVMAPLLAFTPLFQGLVESLYDHYSTFRIQERLQADPELQGVLSEEDFQQIKRSAVERFGGNVDDAYDVYTAGIRRALQRLQTERPIREQEGVPLNGNLSPGERLRMLAEQS